MTSRTKLITAISVAAFLWFIMFNPWMGLQENFWGLMQGSSAILLALVVCFDNPRLKLTWGQVGLGVVIAAALWFVFFIGDKIASSLFDFARGQVDGIYSMGEGTSRWLIAIQLLFVTGPVEEIFWRGYVQKNLSGRFSPFVAMLVTLAIYTLIHIWSFNFMLIMAALVAGAVWGGLYWLKPSWLPALVLSHALWDAVVFVIFPI